MNKGFAMVMLVYALAAEVLQMAVLPPLRDAAPPTLAAFLAERPQLIITDWMMPKVDGLDLCRMIRSHVQEKYAYVIFLTALTGKKYYYEGMEAGADDFLNKPVDMDELTARLRVAERILSLHTEVAQLEGLLPICSYCKKIRDEKDTWQPIEGYISTRTEATFSH